MRRVSYFVLLIPFLLPSCAPAPAAPPQASLLIYRFDPPAFLEFSSDLQPLNEIPFTVPPNCGLFNTFPAPLGRFVLVELSCPNGQTVLFLDTVSASVSQPVTDSDSHFLAWTSDGEAAYLKVDSLSSPRIVRVKTDGTKDAVPITEFTYDLSAKPGSRDFTFAFSRGLGHGSELWLARQDGWITELLHADPYNYISFARFSPDGKQIAFIKIPDSQTPFMVGELWVVNGNGTNARRLADVDSGHGYAANWSPDGGKIAFVVRENPEDENADQSSDALLSNVYVVDVSSGDLIRTTNLMEGRAETPYWSPDGNTLAFNVVINGRMEVHIADIESGGSRSLITESTCCPAWMRK